MMYLSSGAARPIAEAIDKFLCPTCVGTVIGTIADHNGDRLIRNKVVFPFDQIANSVDRSFAADDEQNGVLHTLIEIALTKGAQTTRVVEKGLNCPITLRAKETIVRGLEATVLKQQGAIPRHVFSSAQLSRAAEWIRSVNGEVGCRTRESNCDVT